VNAPEGVKVVVGNADFQVQFAGDRKVRFTPVDDPFYFLHGQCIATSGILEPPNPKLSSAFSIVNPADKISTPQPVITSHSCRLNICLGGGGFSCIAIYSGSAFVFNFGKGVFLNNAGVLPRGRRKLDQPPEKGSKRNRNVLFYGGKSGKSEKGYFGDDDENDAGYAHGRGVGRKLEEYYGGKGSKGNRNLGSKGGYYGGRPPAIPLTYEAPPLPPPFPGTIIGGTGAFEGIEGTVSITTIAGTTGPLVSNIFEHGGYYGRSLGSQSVLPFSGSNQPIGSIVQVITVKSNMPLPPGP